PPRLGIDSVADSVEDVPPKTLAQGSGRGGKRKTEVRGSGLGTHAWSPAILGSYAVVRIRIISPRRRCSSVSRSKRLHATYPPKAGTIQHQRRREQGRRAWEKPEE
ncbi:unnamed protein product, partial [Scytosiphon promiscuus]